MIFADKTPEQVPWRRGWGAGDFLWRVESEVTENTRCTLREAEVAGGSMCI